jgi:hypothetical protein
MVNSYLEILEVIDYYCCRRDFNLPDLQVVNKLNSGAEYFAVLSDLTQIFLFP